MAQAKHAFVSYCRDDKPLIRVFQEELRQNGISVWWDDEILPGQDWKYEIRQAMGTAYAVVVCLSRNLTAREKSGVYPELRDAIDILRTMRPGDVFVIPVRLSDCDIPNIEIDSTRTLDSLQRVDLFPDSERRAQMSKLVRVLQQKAGVNGGTTKPEPAKSKKSRVIVTIDMELDAFDKRSENTLRFGLAGFLTIDAADVSIIAIEEGSVKVTLELPEKAARRLLLLRNEPGLAIALADLHVIDVEVINETIHRGLTPAIDRYRIGMDGRWGLETLADFSRLYSQVYAVVYALNVDHSNGRGNIVRSVFQSYPWRGGFSRVNFYRSVKNLVPPSQRPDIQSIQFASPGAMVLNLIPEIAKMISRTAQRLLDPESRAYDIYRSIENDMSEMDLRKTHVRGQTEDEDSGEFAIRDLTDRQLIFIQQAFSDLAREIDFEGAEQLSKLTGNRLAALKILMSYFRRMRDLVNLAHQDLIQL